MIQTTCPECKDKIQLDFPEIGDRFTCQNCWADLCVRETEPLTVAWYEVPEYESDWNDDDEDDEG